MDKNSNPIGSHPLYLYGYLTFCLFGGLVHLGKIVPQPGDASSAAYWYNFYTWFLVVFFPLAYTAVTIYWLKYYNRK